MKILIYFFSAIMFHSVAHAQSTNFFSDLKKGIEKAVGKDKSKSKKKTDSDVQNTDESTGLSTTEPAESKTQKNAQVQAEDRTVSDRCAALKADPYIGEYGETILKVFKLQANSPFEIKVSDWVTFNAGAGTRILSNAYETDPKFATHISNIQNIATQYRVPIVDEETLKSYLDVIRKINQCTYDLINEKSPRILFMMAKSPFLGLAESINKIQQDKEKIREISYKIPSRATPNNELPKIFIFDKSYNRNYDSQIQSIVIGYFLVDLKDFSLYGQEAVNSAKKIHVAAQAFVEEKNQQNALIDQKKQERDIAEKNEIKAIYAKKYSKSLPKLKVEKIEPQRATGGYFLKITSVDDEHMVLERVLINNKEDQSSCNVTGVKYLTTGDIFQPLIVGCGNAVKVDIYTNRGNLSFRFQ